MVGIVYKKYMLSINAIWFCSDIIETLSKSEADVVFFHGVNENVFRNALVNSQYTLITNLNDTLEDIFKKISKNYKYEINRAKKEHIECKVYKANDFENNPFILGNFKEEYGEFTRLKGIANTYNETAMEKYIKEGNVILTKAFCDKADYAQHIYVCDSTNARLLYSVSNFRTDGMDPNLIGRANKYLHWYDIQYLHNNMFKYLDWGGVSSLINYNGIDLFKKGFGGYEKEYYNVVVGKSFLGRLAVLAKKAKGRIYVFNKVR